MNDDVGDIMTVRQRLYQAVRPGETYTGPVWSADLLAMLQEFDAQAEYIKKIADRLSSEDEEAGGLATQRLRAAEERLHAADVWAHMHATADHACGECRALLRATATEKHEKKMDDHLAEALARLAPDKRRNEWSASERKMMAAVLPGDIDVLLTALANVETRIEAALELNRLGAVHTYHCQSGAGGGGCDDECAQLRKVMLGE